MSTLAFGRGRGPWRQAARRFRRHPLGIAALLVVVAFVVVAFVTPDITPYAGQELFFEYLGKPQPPSLHSGHLLGTDALGHDMLTQLLWAVRESVLGGFGCALAATAIGVIVGIVGGYAEGPFERVIAWLVSVMVTVPALAVLLIVVVHYSPLALWVFPVTLAAYMWTYVARAVQASFSTLRSREYVEAAHAAGASPLRIVFRHLLPNTLGNLLVAATGIVGQSIALIATAVYFGFGNQQSDRPTLGSLISNATHANPLTGTVEPWWLLALPIATLGLLLICLNFAADTLDDVLEPARAA
ncbi:MAG TPA: ABC transporter permease [Gaiellaceae bacterium]|nr:ABC transporter permease [Gaiellaceae bacterium]